jgi:hypothetical protein
VLVNERMSGVWASTRCWHALQMQNAFRVASFPARVLPLQAEFSPESRAILKLKFGVSTFIDGPARSSGYFRGVSIVLTISSTSEPKYYQVAAKLRGLGLQERYWATLMALILVYVTPRQNHVRWNAQRSQL